MKMNAKASTKQLVRPGMKMNAIKRGTLSLAQ
jgi:hypothetical protein